MNLKWLVAIFICFLTISSNAQFSPTIITTKADKELIPEGIAVHPETGTIYLSSLNQNKIISIDKNGVVKNLIEPGQDGFMIGLGMKIDAAGKTLWACSAYNDDVTHKTGLFQVDLEIGEVLQKFIIEDTTSVFFNDLVIDKDGNIYITDTQKSSIFRWNADNKKLEQWLQSDNLKWANGITFSPDEKILFVASASKGIQKIDVATKKISTTGNAQTDFYSIDGLAYYNNSLIAAIGWPQNKQYTHRVLQFHLSADNNIIKTDTLSINTPLLDCPTTVAIAGNNLYVLGVTNLRTYNRNKESTKGIEGVLQKPAVLKYTFKK